MRMTYLPDRRGLSSGLALLLLGSAVWAEDQPQWGQRYSRNMVSAETGLPDRFDPQTGQNVKWSAPLGTECYSTPVIASGRVLIGTNNSRARDPRHRGDRGVLLCLNEADGSLAWQLVVPKLDADIYFDWPQAGMCSPATIEGDRVYTVTNRAEVVCLDLHGQTNGNDGPYRDEGRHMVPEDQPVAEVTALDADILWLLDLRPAAGVRPHDASHSSILLDGQYLYVNTSNGLTSKHDGVDKPDAPSLVVVDKATGRLVAREREGMSRMIFHCTWSSPALGEVAGQRRVFFCGGDGACYGFEPFAKTSSDALQRVWRFDCDPGAPKDKIHTYIRNRQVSPSNIKSMPVFHDGRLYVTGGGDIWWGKHAAWLQCIDATKTGDTTTGGPIWSYAVGRHCCSTPAIHEGLVYVADCDGKVHCVDAQTGRAYWVHDTGAEIWASTLVADGKVYVGTRRGHFWVLAAGKQLQVLSSLKLPGGLPSTTTAANGMLYVATMTTLYAVQQGARTAPAAAQ
jgi:outer membrane protein assembly factor BamB